MISTITSQRAVSLDGDHLIHDTYVNPRKTPRWELVTACHNPVNQNAVLNPEGQPLPVTCAYCVNELRARDRLREVMNAEGTPELDAIIARQQEERRQRAKPLGPIRARWTFIKALREAGIER